MGYKTHSVDGMQGEVSLVHLASRTVSQCVLAPGGAAVLPLHKLPKEAVITAVRGYRVGGSGAVINARKGTGAGTDLATDLSLASADQWMEATLAAAGTLEVAAGDTLQIEIVSVAGSPTSVSVEVEYRIEIPNED